MPDTMAPMRAFVTLLATSSLFACTPVEVADPVPEGPTVWEEGDDNENEEPHTAEEVDDDWTEELVIQGRISSCGWDNSPPDGDWGWSGDNDAYNVEVPEDGYLQASLAWEFENENQGLPDLDFLCFINPSGSTWNTDFSAQGTNNPEEWEPEQEFARGDDIVFVVACPQGGDTDYTLTVSWEE